MRAGRGSELFGVILAAAVIGCGGSEARPDPSADAGSGGDPLTCTVTAPTSCPAPPPRYANVQAIIQQNCVGPCHSGVDPAGPWPLTDYQHVADWADLVRADLLTCAMPPADGGVTLPADDRLAILTWLRCGFPE